MKMRFWWYVVEKHKFFHRYVESLEEAEITFNAIADFNLFIQDSGLMPDYSNGYGLEVQGEETSEWYEWEGKEGTPEEYMDFSEYLREKEKWEMNSLL